MAALVRSIWAYRYSPAGHPWGIRASAPSGASTPRGRARGRAHPRRPGGPRPFPTHRFTKAALRALVEQVVREDYDYIMVRAGKKAVLAHNLIRWIARQQPYR